LELGTGEKHAPNQSAVNDAEMALLIAQR